MIRLRREEESLDNIGQYWVDCKTSEAKYRSIANIYGVVNIGQAIIFCQTRQTASWLAEKMTKDGHAVALLSGYLSVEDRISLSFFKFLKRSRKTFLKFRKIYSISIISENV